MTTTPAQRIVECPFCHHRQNEPATVVGTVCQACRESYAVPPQESAGAGIGMGLLARTLSGRVRGGWSALIRPWRTGPESARLRRGKFVATPFTLADPGEIEGGQVRGTRRVACPFCQAPARLPSGALSHCCAECGRHYRLQDRDIYGEVHANLATAGTVIVHHGARLVSASVRCGELVVHGQVGGALTVTGRAVYHGRGEAVGELHCGHLVIARGAHRSFHQRIFAMAADIHGEITGDICCAGRLQVSRGGAINGSVLAGQIAIDAGGRINGSMATLQAVLRPDARLTSTAREFLKNFGQETGE